MITLISCSLCHFLCYTSLFIVIFFIPLFLVVSCHHSYKYLNLWILAHPFDFLRYRRYAKLFNQKGCTLTKENIRFLKDVFGDAYFVIKKMYEVPIVRLFFIYLQEKGIFRGFILNYYSARVGTYERYKYSTISLPLNFQLIDDLMNLCFRYDVRNMIGNKYDDLKDDLYYFHRFMVITQNIYSLPKHKELRKNDFYLNDMMTQEDLIRVAYSDGVQSNFNELYVKSAK